ncbi:hypothetical protein PsYK624_011360 [Phanerochaete sordida]|uniref:Uncharacterized protein n=1 Tax=Phanerochaete sordida TaxID=48140 RepID=A0A9P3L820_9APHY|nr:hypothetical protein PsYK624_011360 [Phanerochaete sordida]
MRRYLHTRSSGPRCAQAQRLRTSLDAGIRVRGPARRHDRTAFCDFQEAGGGLCLDSVSCYLGARTGCEFDGGRGRCQEARQPTKTTSWPCNRPAN